MSIGLPILRPDAAVGATPPPAPDKARRPGRLVDSHGRTIRDMRLSVTDRCNYRCVYCMDPDFRYMPKRELLSFDEYVTIARVCASLGIEKLRITGGEPTLYPHLDELIATLGGMGFKDIAMTTNGSRLDRQPLARWRRDGLGRLTVEQDLDNVERMIAGIKQVLDNSGLEGWEESYELLASQLNDYGDWVRAEILPRSRDSHLLPAEIYADNLKNFGVDMDPRELIQRATFGFMEIRNEMQAIARRIAEQRGWESSDYRDVMRKLKEDQIEVDQVLDLYRERLKILEDIIRREDIVSLPDRDAVIRLATEAEAAAIPAPFMSPPPLIGNTGQHGEFVLVASNPNAPAGAKMDDFTHDSVTWTLTVHEARPGHEMQFSAMIENGVSTARGVFAFNSANVEGWALYAEAIMKEYLPLEGQLFSLHGRLMRAARAFLDPMLNLGELEPDEVQQFLKDELVLSTPMAQSEANRYAFLAPGQATSYYFGFMNLQSMRAKAELALRDKFNQREYHDFILAQGFLPPKLLEEVIMEEFVKPRL